MAKGETYDQFVDKFKPKLTTDDCYTPAAVYDAVAGWVAKEYKLDQTILCDLSGLAATTNPTTILKGVSLLITRLFRSSARLYASMIAKKSGFSFGLRL